VRVAAGVWAKASEQERAVFLDEVTFSIEEASVGAMKPG
jgi:hypothetical protein